MSTHVTVVGTIATEPTLLQSSQGVQLCSFRVASDERRFDRTQQVWVDGNTNWFTVVCSRSLAEHASESFHKGQRIVVSGRLRVRNWEKEDKRGVTVEVEAESVGHDLRWGVSQFERRTLSSEADQMSSDGFTPVEAEEPAVGSPEHDVQEQEAA